MAEIRKINIKPGETIHITCEESEAVQTTPGPSYSGGESAAEKQKGSLRYKVGLVSDLHFDAEDSHNSEYAQDFINAIDYFRNAGVDFLCNAGDICQYNDNDLKLYNEYYTTYAWAPTNAGLRIFTSLGNHDYLRLFSKGQDLGKLNNYIAPFTGEDYWKQYGYAQKTDYIQFFEYDGQWNEQQYGKGRTVKSKLSYWVELHGDIYIFLSIDYGDHANPAVWDYCARGMNRLDYNNKYVQMMMDYVSDTPYDRSRETNFDYQFYHPNSLTWLKDIVENNRDKRIFLFMHHFMPNMSGDTNQDYSHLRIWPVPTSAAIQQKYYSGSNTPTGLTFWFLDKLLRENLNIVCFGGHSHYEWGEQVDIVRRAYYVKQPTGNEVTPLVDDLNSLNGTQYDYRLYTTVGHSYADCAPTIHLPSLSKPVNRAGQSLYGASQGAIMEVYDNGVSIQCIAFKNQGDTRYRNQVIGTIDL